MSPTRSMGLTLTMFRLSLVTLVIMICYFSSSESQYRHYQTIYFESFVPSVRCNFNWVLTLDRNCTWCEAMFMAFIPPLTRSHNPSSIYTENKENNISWTSDLKGTCFVNWFIGINFELLTEVVQSHGSIQHESEKWIIFIDVSY